MNRMLFVWALLLGLAACKSSKETTNAANSTGEIPADFALTLERSGCMGTCPAYMIHVQADGKVFYDGYSHAPLKGKHTKQISEARVKALIKALNDARFWEMKAKYDNPNITDLPSTTLKATLDGKSHSVLDRFESPDEVKNLSILVDEIIGLDGFEPFNPGK
ncbi:MAG: DUF6438 domain-containing protein [Bacteroidota bacterium]